jgi:large subunit ribosomal protein L49
MVARPPTPLPTITPEAFAAAPWTIRRTAFAQLPVYREWKAGKTKEVIMIKKVSGNKKLLMEQLREKANIPAEKIVLSPVTGHIEVTVR